MSFRFQKINLKNNVKEEIIIFFEKYLSPEDILYDVGCGTKPFAPYTKGKVAKHIGVDLGEGFYDRKHIDLIGSAYEVPAKDGVADVVLSSQVLEHLDNPEKAIEETSRLLKTGGYFLCSFPFLYPLHATPHDFTRLSEFAMQKHFEKNNLELIEMKRIGGFWYIVGMYTEMYLQTFDRGFFKTFKIMKLFSWLTTWLFSIIHAAEGLTLGFAGSSKLNAARDRWTVNYIIVAQKK